jgi:cation diffusion facilitator CzcD-associated flavoprotein CzcO
MSPPTGTEQGGRAPRVAVIGAGMSGLLMGIRLREAGIRDFTLYEKTADVGGTWRENRYPGLSCDVPSHLYSYSFEPNPEWTHRYSFGPEIHAYFQKVADKYDLRARIRFETEITEARRADGCWRLRTRSGETSEADFVISACGVLHHPRYPEIDGLDSFAGPAFHTARWPDALDLSGKRVGVIGTGSTSIQLVPEVARVAQRLSLFQRTPQWVFPLLNKAYTPEQRERLRRSPARARLMHWYYGKLFELFSSAVRGNRVLLAMLARGSRRNLEQVRDPELRRKLTPDYQAACKRLIFSSEFYSAVQRPNVDVVIQKIQRIAPEGVVTGDGVLHPLDVLVLATGFHAHDYMRPMKLVGEDGRTLDDAWKDGPHAYRTVALPGFPNFFMLIGPHSPIGNYSLIDIAELQAGYIMECLSLYTQGRCTTVEPSDAATRAFNAALKGSFAGTVWLSGCDSWYLDQNGLPNVWPWSYAEFRRQMKQPVLEELRLS